MIGDWLSMMIWINEGRGAAMHLADTISTSHVPPLQASVLYV